jgi:hypothetical protein
VSDVGRSFAYPFRHPRWVGRALIGAALEVVPVVLLLPGILSLARHRYLYLVPRAAILLLPVAAALGLGCRFIVFGYLGRAAREVLDGSSTGLPAWDRVGDDLLDGLKLWLVALALWLPAVAVTAGFALLVMALTSPGLAWLPVILVGLPAALLTLAYLPAGLLAVVSEGKLGAAFSIDRVTVTVGRAFGPYALAFLVALGAEIFAQLGLALCWVGIFATRFIAHCVTVHAFATAYGQGTQGAASASPEVQPSAPTPEGIPPSTVST